MLIFLFILARYANTVLLLNGPLYITIKNRLYHVPIKVPLHFGSLEPTLLAVLIDAFDSRCTFPSKWA